MRFLSGSIDLKNPRQSLALSGLGATPVEWVPDPNSAAGYSVKNLARTGKGGLTTAKNSVKSAQYNDILGGAIPAARGPRPPDSLIATDKFGYLREVLKNHDWQGVGRWYGIELQRMLGDSVYANDYWNIATLNLRDYTSEPWDVSDLRGFAEYVFAPYVINDLGAKVGMGANGDWWDLDLSANNGAVNLWQSWAHIKNGNAYGPLQLGWIKDPGSGVAKMVFNLVAGAIVGAGIFAAYQAIVQAASAASAGAAGAAAIAPTAVTAPVAVAAETAANTALISSAAASGAIDTIIVTAVAPSIISAGTIAAVGGGLAAGAIVATSAPPPLSAPQINPGQTIEEVITTATRLPAITPGVISSGAGAVIGLATNPPAIFETPAQAELQTPDENSGQDSGDDGETPTMLDRVRDALAELAGTLGLQYVQDYLGQLLAEQLGRQPTDAEILAYSDDLNSRMNPLAKAVPWILAVIVGTLVIKKYRRKKTGAKKT